MCEYHLSLAETTFLRRLPTEAYYRPVSMLSGHDVEKLRGLRVGTLGRSQCRLVGPTLVDLVHIQVTYQFYR